MFGKLLFFFHHSKIAISYKSKTEAATHTGHNLFMSNTII